jgi:hypothetical protein
VLDWHHHAIDELAHHPIGVYRAQCSHLLMMVTTLHESPPSRICPSCPVGRGVSADKGTAEHDRRRVVISVTCSLNRCSRGLQPGGPQGRR